MSLETMSTPAQEPQLEANPISITPTPEAITRPNIIRMEGVVDAVISDRMPGQKELQAEVDKQVNEQFASAQAMSGMRGASLDRDAYKAENQIAVKTKVYEKAEGEARSGVTIPESEGQIRERLVAERVREVRRAVGGGDEAQLRDFVENQVGENLDRRVAVDARHQREDFVNDNRSVVENLILRKVTDELAGFDKEETKREVNSELQADAVKFKAAYEKEVLVQAEAQLERERAEREAKAEAERQPFAKKPAVQERISQEDIRKRAKEILQSAGQNELERAVELRRQQALVAKAKEMVEELVETGEVKLGPTMLQRAEAAMAAEVTPEETGEEAPTPDTSASSTTPVTEGEPPTPPGQVVVEEVRAQGVEEVQARAEAALSAEDSVPLEHRQVEGDQVSASEIEEVSETRPTIKGRFVESLRSAFGLRSMVSDLMAARKIVKEVQGMGGSLSEGLKVADLYLYGKNQARWESFWSKVGVDKAAEKISESDRIVKIVNKMPLPKGTSLDPRVIARAEQNVFQDLREKDAGALAAEYASRPNEMAKLGEEILAFAPLKEAAERAELAQLLTWDELQERRRAKGGELSDEEIRGLEREVREHVEGMDQKKVADLRGKVIKLWKIPSVKYADRMEDSVLEAEYKMAKTVLEEMEKGQQPKDGVTYDLWVLHPGSITGERLHYWGERGGTEAELREFVGSYEQGRSSLWASYRARLRQAREEQQESPAEAQARVEEVQASAEAALSEGGVLKDRIQGSFDRLVKLSDERKLKASVLFGGKRDEYIWQKVLVGNAPEFRSEQEIYRGYVMVTLNDIPEVVEKLQQLGEKRGEKGLNYKYLLGIIPEGVNQAEYSNHVGEYEGMASEAARIVVYGKALEDVKEILGELAQDPDWERIEENRVNSDIPSRRPGAHAYGVLAEEGEREWRTLSYNDQPGFSEDQAQEGWRLEKRGTETGQLGTTAGRVSAQAEPVVEEAVSSDGMSLEQARTRLQYLRDLGKQPLVLGEVQARGWTAEERAEVDRLLAAISAAEASGENVIRITSEDVEAAVPAEMDEIEILGEPEETSSRPRAKARSLRFGDENGEVAVPTRIGTDPESLKSLHRYVSERLKEVDPELKVTGTGSVEGHWGYWGSSIVERFAEARGTGELGAVLEDLGATPEQVSAVKRQVTDADFETAKLDAIDLFVTRLSRRYQELRERSAS